MRSARLAPVALAILVLAGCRAELYGGLEEREANEIVAALAAEGVRAEKRAAGKDEGFSVLVTESDFPRAVTTLEAVGLPREGFASLGDVFTGEGMVSSATEERARLMYGLGQELSRTISSIDGVLSARVHVSLPEKDPLARTPVGGGASVFIRRDAAVANEGLVPQVKMLVANAVDGLSYEQITVVDLPVDVAARRSALAASARLPENAPAAQTYLIAAVAAAAGLAVGAGGTWLSRQRRSAPRTDAEQAEMEVVSLPERRLAGREARR